MTWLDHKALVIARQLREPASRRRYTRRLHELDPVHGGHRSREDMCLLHETPRERVLFPGCRRRITDLRGNRYGRLMVTGFGGRRGRVLTWVCRCDCGRSVTVRAANLTKGHTRSCGCLAVEQGLRLAEETNKKKGGNHGQAGICQADE